jgi:anion-transporting  ArsA/GET3 family ATPase
MGSPLSRSLLVVTGKGGTGKSTVAAALGLLAARRGIRTVLVEMGGRRAAPELLGAAEHDRGERGEVALSECLWGATIDPEQALLEWLGAVGGGVAARLLFSRASFRVFAAAAPGAKELVTLVRVLDLTRPPRGRSARARYDLAILDAPATGHALALLRAPATFAAIARVGPVAAEAAAVRELLEDPARSGYVAVAHPSELAVTETLRVASELRRELGRELERVVVNGVFTRRFTRADLEAISRLEQRGGASGAVPSRAPRAERVIAAAAAAARFDHERSRRQQNEIARLRRRGLPVVSLPFLTAERIDRAALEHMADRLARGFAEAAAPSPA